MRGKETIREVRQNLWVADQQSAEVLGMDFDYTVNCTGELPLGIGANHDNVTPTGSTGHAWEPPDLNEIVRCVIPALKEGKTVLIYCKRGISRSTTAAAACLLAMGDAPTLENAIDRTRSHVRVPASQCVGGLKRWWESQR
jgi:hypothetical protein